MRVHNSIKFARLSLTLAAMCGLASAEQGILVVHVSDPQDRPIENVRLATQGDGSTGAPTTGQGRTRIKLAAQTRAKTWVTLQIIQPKDLVFVSPWDKRVQVPPFENESDNFVPVVLIERGDRLALESGQHLLLTAIASQVNQANSKKAANQTGNQGGDQTALQDVAREFGLAPEDVDRAIRTWGKKVTDPYEAGLAALYERSYPEASKLLASSLEMREQELQQAQTRVGDAAFFLGSSLYGQGRYRESADAYRKALSVRGEDATTLNNLALSLHSAGDYAAAEPLIRRALAIDEKALGPEHPATAMNLENLAELLEDKGDYAGAEPLLRQVLAIREKVLGPDHPDTASILDNLGGLMEDKGDYAAAEPLYRQALAIREKVLGPEHPDTATSLDNLGGLLEVKGDYAEAEPLYRQALAIREKVLGPEHPDTATSLDNLGGLLDDKGDHAEAEPLYRRALAIREKVLGPEHPDTATSLNNLGALLDNTGDHAAAEPLYRRALAIREKVLGPDHPDTATSLENLAALLKVKGDYAEAEPLLRQALATDERVFGADARRTQRVRSSLEDVQKRQDVQKRLQQRQ
jgi:tetratricopeptide (TPR) repeat protein